MTPRHQILEPDPATKRGVCSQCGPVVIYRTGTHKGKTYWRCGPHQTSYQISRYRSDEDLQRNPRFKRLYGITVDEYEQMLIDQGGVCARCSSVPDESRRLAVDHCHTTGRVRGLLCGPCNTYLGRLEANLDRLAKDLTYLERKL